MPLRLDDQAETNNREAGLGTPMKISVIVPVYNERDNIAPLYERLIPVLREMDGSYEVVFTNDGSSDGSGDVLDTLAGKDSAVKVIHLKRNYGQTAALMAGISYSSGDIIVPMDGDFQNDPTDIPHLLAKLAEGYDVVSGWRKERKEGLSRRLPSRIANWLISKISGVPLHDYGCTLKAYRREVLENVRLYGEMHRFIPIYAAWEGGRVTELPVKHHPRRSGSSKYDLGRAPRVLLDLIVIRFLDSGIDRPIQFFGRAGLYSFGLAFLAGLWALYLKLFEGVSFIQTPLPMLVVLLALVGLMLVMMGLLGEIQSRIYFEAQDKRPFAVRETRNLHAGSDQQDADIHARRSL
jgi:glycosyltransferase involved in cell wall biosynthesis